MLKTYLDQSGGISAEEGRLVTIAGGVAPSAKWGELVIDWETVKGRFGIDVHHSNKFFARQGEFKKWANAKNEPNAYYLALSQVVLSHVTKIIGSTIDVALHEDSRRNPLGRILNDCIGMAIHSSQAVCNIMGFKDNVEIIIDSSPYDGEALKAYRGSKWNKRVVQIGFSSAKERSELQAADLIAYEVHRYQRGKPTEFWGVFSRSDPWLIAGRVGHRSATKALEPFSSDSNIRSPRTR